MKLKYSKEITCTDLENKLGLPPNTMAMTNSPDGTIEFESKEELTVAQLALLNREFPGFKRDYTEVPFKKGEVRDMEKEMDALAIKVNTLEVKSG